MLTRHRSSKRVHEFRKPAATGLEGLLSIYCMPLADLPVRRTQSIDSYLARSTGESVTAGQLSLACSTCSSFCAGGVIGNAHSVAELSLPHRGRLMRSAGLWLGLAMPS